MSFSLLSSLFSLSCTTIFPSKKISLGKAVKCRFWRVPTQNGILLLDLYQISSNFFQEEEVVLNKTSKSEKSDDKTILQILIIYMTVFLYFLFHLISWLLFIRFFDVLVRNNNSLSCIHNLYRLDPICYQPMADRIKFNLLTR